MLRKFIKRLVWICISIVILVPLLLVQSLRWWDPPTSAFMIERQIDAQLNKERGFRLRYQWVDWKLISPHAAVAILAAEDQRFPEHYGFDLDAIEDAFSSHRQGKPLRGASTISQQVAKNLFLWSGRSWLRKGLEAWFTFFIELTWPKQRILEVYLNIAEFGNGIYGIDAAAQNYFHKPAAEVTAAEAATLAAVLPNPRILKVEQPSVYVQERREWILQQMQQLGGARLLEKLNR